MEKKLAKQRAKKERHQKAKDVLHSIVQKPERKYGAENPAPSALPEVPEVPVVKKKPRKKRQHRGVKPDKGFEARGSYWSPVRGSRRTRHKSRAPHTKSAESPESSELEVMESPAVWV